MVWPPSDPHDATEPDQEHYGKQLDCPGRIAGRTIVESRSRLCVRRVVGEPAKASERAPVDREQAALEGAAARTERASRPATRPGTPLARTGGWTEAGGRLDSFALAGGAAGWDCWSAVGVRAGGEGGTDTCGTVIDGVGSGNAGTDGSVESTVCVGASPTSRPAAHALALASVKKTQTTAAAAIQQTLP
jgi:hypothetical protein